MENSEQYASRADFERYASIPFHILGGCVMSRSGERSVRIRDVKGSIPLISTNLIAGRTPEVTIVVLPYGFVLATQIKDRL